LDWEDKQAKQDEFEAMAEQWQANDPSRQIILRSIEYAVLGQERLMYSERKRIEGLMASVDIATTFCQRAGGFEVLDAIYIPAWYFTEDDRGIKDFSVLMRKVHDQAQELKNQYSDQMMGQVKARYPELYQYVTETRPITEPFGIALGRRYGQSTPTLNLQTLMTDIEKKFAYSLKWARDPIRYEAIIAGLRAEQLQAGMDLEKSTRYATNFQNRILKGFAALSHLAQYEQQQLSHEVTAAIEHEHQKAQDDQVVEPKALDEPF
jgi:hypothetical protein